MKALLILHVLGAAVWIGGHVVLLSVVVPAARRSRDVAPVLEFERGYGRVGLGALVVQLVTGVLLASRWIGGWSNFVLFREPTPGTPLVAGKLGLLVAIVAIGGYAYHALLPGLTIRSLGAFVNCARVVTVLSVLMLVLGIGVRTGGLL